MTDDEATKRSPKRSGGLTPEDRLRIGRTLGPKRYVDLKSEPVPERFLELLKKLEEPQR